MNKIYRIVWSQALRTWVVVSELTTARGKRSGGADARRSVVLVPLAVAGLFGPAAAWANCTTAAPATGATVTCDATSPNPFTPGISAIAADNVTVNVLGGASVQTGNQAGVNLGSNVTVNNQGTVLGTTHAINVGSGLVINQATGVLGSSSVSGVAFGGTGNREVQNAGVMGRVIDTNFPPAGTTMKISNAATGKIVTDLNGAIVTKAALALTNDGEIRSNAGVGVIGTGQPATVTNRGVISGTTYGVQLTGPNNSVYNAGTISGGTNAIWFKPVTPTDTGTNTLTLDTGSVLNGNVVGRAATATTADNLVLQGTGTEDSQFQDFDNLTMQGTDWTLSGNSTFASSVAVNAGALRLAGDVTTANTSVANGATLSIGSADGATGSLTGTIANNGSLFVNRNGNLTLGAITGTGTLDKSGSGTLSLSSGTNYSGATTVSGGTLNVGNLNVLANSSSVHLAAGTTLLGDAAVGGVSSTLNNLSGDAGSQIAGFDDITLANTSDTAFAGVLQSRAGGVGNVQKTGSGTLLLTGYSPQTWRALKVLGGALEVADGGRLAVTSGGTQIANNASLHVVDGGALTLGGVNVYQGLLDVGQGGTATAVQLTAGTNAGDVSTVTVSQGGLLSSTHALLNSQIGLNGTGTLDVATGGVYNSTGVVVGVNAGSVGTALVDGAGSAWNGSSTVTIGNSGTGSVAVDHDATMKANSVVLANNAGSTGTLALRNGGTLTTGQVAAGAGTAGFAMDDGTLRASAASTDFISNLTGGVDLAAGGGTIDSNGFDISSSAAMTGTGAFTKAGAGTLTLNAATSTYAGGTDVQAGTLAITNSGALGSGTATVDSGATLAVAPAVAGDFTFANALAGTGTFSVGLADASNAFAFADASGGFAGTARLGKSRFALSGTNTAALANATLELDTDNTTTVGTGTQTIGGLNLNGGSLVFPGVRVPGSATADASLAVGDLALNGGNIALDFGSSGLVNHPAPSGEVNLLAQDDDVQLQLIAASGTISGSGSNLAFIDSNTQQQISNAVQTDVYEGGNLAAIADYDFIFNTADAAGDQGLFVGYGLRQLDLQAGQTLTLAPDAGATGLATDLAAKVTGAGNLAIDAGSNLVSLSNSANDYTGDTHVQSGTLSMNGDHVLGATSLLDVANGASVAMNGHTQTVGKLVTQAGSHLQLDGALTVSGAQRASGDASGGTIEGGTLAGAGTLTLDPSIVEVNGANTAYTGNVDVTGGSQLILNNAQGVGDTGTITLASADDRLTLGQVTAAPGVSPNGTLAKQLAGAGSVQLRDNANVTLSGDNSAFAGDFDIASATTLSASQPTQLGTATIANAGTLNLTADSDWSLDNTVTGDGTLVKSGGATLAVDQALANFTGPTQVNAGTLQLAANGAMAGDAAIASGAQLTALDGAFVHGSVTNAGTLTANAGNATVGSLNNAGLVRLDGATVGNTLTVAGNYTGQGGTVQINTVLGDDNSPTDRLVVQGDTAGSSLLHVNAVSGSGAYSTADGIQVVRVDGQSNGTFGLAGPVEAGAFEYDLYHGGKADPNDGDWYLRSEAPVVVTPPGGAGGPSDGSGTGAGPAPAEPSKLKPGVGAYLGNQHFASTMLQQTLRDRAGELAFADEGQDGGVAGWARVQRDQLQAGVDYRGAHQIDVRGDSNVVQVGAEMVRRPGDGRLHMGLMGSHGEADTHSQSEIGAHSEAAGRVKGNAVGAYATWFANANAAPGESTGLYVDGWAQAGRFDNQVRRAGLPTESYDSRSWSASLEAGYGLAVHRGEHSTVYLEPQVQAIYSDVSTDDHVEANLTHVQGFDAKGLTTRVGARLYGRADAGTGKRVQPFVEANWWHNGHDDGIAFDDVRTNLNSAGNMYEVKFGAEAELGKKWTGWGNLGVQQGNHDDRGVTGMVGIRKGW